VWLQALLKYNNFHTLMAFLSAFNNSAVLRLKWTRERLPAPTKKVRPPPPRLDAIPVQTFPR
jgi:hypothetical protein